MNRFTRIFFEMRTGYANAFNRAIFKLDVDMTQARKRVVRLAGLIAFWRGRIEVVVTRKYRRLIDVSIDAQTKANRKINHFFVQYRKYARHSQINQAGLRVWIITENSR